MGDVSQIAQMIDHGESYGKTNDGPERNSVVSCENEKD
jgi:hypothetical protein